MTDQPRVWAIRAGRRSSAHSLFVENDVVALGDMLLPDLGGVKPVTRKEFTTAVKRLLVEQAEEPLGPTELGIIAGTMYRFIHEMKTGDIIVYPATHVDRTIHLGRVTGRYRYLPGAYPHQREVSWQKILKREEFSPAVLSEMSAFSAFFEIKRHPDKVRSKLS